MTNKHSDKSIGKRETTLVNTSVSGKINRVDETLLQITGFKNDELVGSSHNDIIHEEMPRQLYEEAVARAKKNRPWLGLVKQRRKNGETYWTDTIMTPVNDNGQLESIRWIGAYASDERIARAEKAYQQLNAGHVPRATKSAMALRTKLFIMVLCGMLPMAAYSIWAEALPAFILPLLILFSTALITIGGWLILNPLCKVVEQTKELYDEPLSRWIYSGRRDEAGQIELTIRLLQGKFVTLLGRIDDAAVQLARVSQQLDNSVALSLTCVHHQETEAANVSAAINEMAVTVQDMAANASSASLMAQNGVDQALQGSGVIENTISRIQKLAGDVATINQRLQNLAQESHNIGSILDVIRDIAEQTNLLALNAAIEAARAGEQGRGFAVVADEVRTLATRTHESTQQIQTMLEKFKTEVQSAADLMATGVKHANETSQNASEADVALGGIARNIAAMNDINAHIASATEEEGAVIEEINLNMTNLKDVSDLAAESMDETNRVSVELVETAHRLQNMVRQFREDL